VRPPAGRAWPALLLSGALAIGGCAAPPLPARDAEAAGCGAGLRRVDARIEASGVADGASARMAGFPYLRVNRALAYFRPAPDAPAFAPWAARLRALDRRARAAEMANLGVGPADRRRIETCAGRLLARALDSAGARRAMLAAAVVADDYATWKRVLGLYPLTSLGLLAGVDLLQREVRERFAMPLRSLPVHGRLVRFVPRGPQGAVVPDAPLPRDALGLITPDPADLAALLAAHAPVFEVDVVQPDDRPGRVRLAADASPRIDPATPVVYHYASHAVIGGEPVLQLVFLAWFRSRPLSGPLDILGGEIDGLMWRVTLDADGRPLIYDSIHACGCYHLVFPTARVAPRTPPQRYEEPLIAPQQVPRGSGRVVLRIAHRTHYIERVHRDRRGAGVVYALRDYHELRSLPLPAGARRSLFRPDGLVPVSRRRERWLLWMAGIASPGAMRQPGRHAIAFVGRRHFDDPLLLERYFRRRER
jgi:hypothetical protein